MTNRYLPPPREPESGPPESAATRLAQLLQRGERPSPIAVPLRLERGEECFLRGPANVESFIPAGDGSYTHKTRFGFSPLGVAIGVGTMIGNQARKAKAAYDSRENWRSIGKGTVFVTTNRIALNQGKDWINTWYGDIMTADCDGQYVAIQRNSGPALRLNTPNIHYFYVMLYWLAFDQVVEPPDGS